MIPSAPPLPLLRRFAGTLFAAGLVLAAAVLSGPAPAQAPAAATASARDVSDGLTAKIEELIRTCKLEKARVGVAVVDPADGHPLVRFHADEPFTLASNTKLLTTSTFFCRLGPDYPFRTTLARRGTLGADGTLDGDLVVIGGGDPALTILRDEKDPAALFRDWAKALKQAGVRRVAGGIVLDDTVFDREYFPETWRIYDCSPWWGAPIGGLVLNDSCVDLLIRPDVTAGAPVAVNPRPRTAFLRIQNEARTAGDKARQGIGYLRKPGTNDVVVKGDLARGASSMTVNVSVNNPVLYFGTVLRETLEAEGIPVAGPAAEIDPAAPARSGELTVVDVRTTPARDILKLLNKKSHNLYAEAFLKTLGREKRGAGTRAAGLEVVQEFLGEVGIAENTKHTDGSGLSRDNQESPDQMVKLLAFMRTQKHFKAWYDSLPVAGEDGTLRRRMRKAPAKGKVVAKTGHIGGVAALSGYLENADGRTLLFSILVNEVQGSTSGADRLQDDLCAFLVTYRP